MVVSTVTQSGERLLASYRQNWGQERSSYGDSGRQGSRGGRLQSLDSVVLSAAAPKPLLAGQVEAAGQAAQEVAEGTVAAGTVRNLREDRVFAALTILAAVGQSGQGSPRGWPGGLPAPTREELSTAYRRLAQRLDRPEQVSDPSAAQNLRRTILDHFRGEDFSAIALASDA